jgi:hypothetical protein
VAREADEFAVQDAQLPVAEAIFEPIGDDRPAPTRRGFLARLFGRRRRSVEEFDQAWQPSEPALPEHDVDAFEAPAPEADAFEPAELDPEPRPEAIDEPEPATVEAVEAPGPLRAAADAIAQAYPIPEQSAQDAISARGEQHAHASSHDLSAELRAAEEATAAEVEAVLTSMLDRLGAAHHRPFSRG